jgi:hypothetical protein
MSHQAKCLEPEAEFAEIPGTAIQQNIIAYLKPISGNRASPDNADD